MTQLELPGSLVNAGWLQQHLQHPDLVLFDASWHMPATGRNGYAEWRQACIPGARFFDFDGRICDTESELPHMLPDEQKFTRELRALGLNSNSRVVVYDALGIFSSARAWWMLKAMGCTQIALLDGGLPAWKAAGNAVAPGDDAGVRSPGNFSARLDANAVADARRVLAALDDVSTCVLDARPAERFSGAAEEPRAGLRRGHMPGAGNLPFGELFADGLLRPDAELEQILKPFTAACERVICSCGSGVTACILAFALQRAGFDQVAVYDGSWSEWGLPGDLPVVAD